MRYQVKQKIFSLRDRFDIRDSNGNPVYTVEGKMLSLSDRFSFCDISGNEIYNCRKKVLAFLPEYYIFEGDIQIATLKKEFTFFRPKFHLESKFGKYYMEGDFFSYNFEIRKGGLNIASISKQFFSISDTYGIDISDSENQAFILTIVIILDFIFHNSSNS
jgi:uncharacterized protein YxjI